MKHISDTGKPARFIAGVVQLFGLFVFISWINNYIPKDKISNLAQGIWVLAMESNSVKILLVGMAIILLLSVWFIGSKTSKNVKVIITSIFFAGLLLSFYNDRVYPNSDIKKWFNKTEQVTTQNNIYNVVDTIKTPTKFKVKEVIPETKVVIDKIVLEVKATSNEIETFKTNVKNIERIHGKFAE